VSDGANEMTRRLPPPWRAEKFSGGYVVRDANGFAVAYVYGRSTEDEAITAKQMTMDEARRAVVAVPRLPIVAGAQTTADEPSCVGDTRTEGNCVSVKLRKPRHPNALRGKTKIFYGPPPHAFISFRQALQRA
jgi:hypothetical protein